MDHINSVLLLGPPLPQKVSRLLYRTVVKTIRMNTPGIGINDISDLSAVNRYAASSIAELAANPADNFGRLAEIARTNALDLAIQTRKNDISTTLVWTGGDAYYRPSREVIEAARENDIQVINDLEGEHDEVVLHPDKFLASVLSARG